MNELITVVNDRPVVSSRQVAESFEKNHQHILRDLDDIKGGVQNWTDLFIESEYQHSQNKQTYREYLLTRDGFSLLAMGFTGQKALTWKLKYIEAFNSMEAELNTPEKIMARALRIADEELKNLKLTNSRLTTENMIMAPKADYFDEMVDRNLLTNFRDTAKMYNIKQKNFIDFLIAKKYIYRDGKGKLMPYADKNNGLFEVKESINKETEWKGLQTMITPKGRETFRLLIKGLN